MRLAAALISVLICALPFAAAAFSPAGLSFTHHDWELACDNTGTCRAAGYSTHDADHYAVSVLLTRQAGPGQTVSGQVMLGQYGENEVVEALPAKFSLALWINGTASGSLAFTKDTLVAALSPRQATALSAALANRAAIEMRLGGHIWRLSDKGAAAVLLKMDEYQGRIGTQGALVRKGGRPESDVPAAVPAPKASLAPLQNPQPTDAGFLALHGKPLRAALSAGTKATECERLADGEEEPEMAAHRLSPTQMLVSARC